MAAYRLVYFNGRDRAEVARMMFNMKKVKFEDQRIEMNDWPTVMKDKKLCPMAQVPVLLINGENIQQSGAINRYIARELGFYGQNNLEAALIDAICDTRAEIREKVTNSYMVPDEDKPVDYNAPLEEQFGPVMKKWEASKNKYKEWSKKYFEFLQDRLRQAGGKHFVGNKLSLADLEVFNLLDLLSDGAFSVAGLVGQYPDLEKFYKGLPETDPALKAYIASRPRSDF